MVVKVEFRYSTTPIAHCGRNEFQWVRRICVIQEAATFDNPDGRSNIEPSRTRFRRSQRAQARGPPATSIVKTSW